MTTTTKKAVEALVSRLCFDPPRCRAVARALTEAGRLPAGSPGHAPTLDAWHLVDLLLGVAADVPLRAVAATVTNYRGLAPGGADLSTAPQHLRRTAGDHLDILAEMAANGTLEAQREVAAIKIEIVTSWPEIAIHEAGKTYRFQPVGSLSGHWQDGKHRRAVTINGAALVEAIRDLFPKE